LKSAVGQVGLPPQWLVKFSLTAVNDSAARYVPAEPMEGLFVVKAAYMAECEIVLMPFDHPKCRKSAFFECFCLVGLD
jgi:hypothetical protein